MSSRMVNVKLTFDDNQRCLISTNNQKLLISHIEYLHQYISNSISHFLNKHKYIFLYNLI